MEDDFALHRMPPETGSLTAESRNRTSGRHCPETGFAAMRTQSTFCETSLPPTGLLDRNSFRLARHTTTIGNNR